MLIYYSGPQEHRDEALAASHYHCTRWVERREDADAILIVWDGNAPPPRWVRGAFGGTTPSFIYRIPT